MFSIILSTADNHQFDGKPRDKKNLQFNLFITIKKNNCNTFLFTSSVLLVEV